MKTLKLLIAVMGVALAASSTALAHEGHEHPAGNGLFGLSPEYIHVLINPMPVYGMAMGILALGAALLARNKTAQTIALGLVIVAAASAWPVAHYGQNAFKQIRGQADDAGAVALDEHMERAEKLVYVFYATAVLGLAALVTRKKFPKAAGPLTVTTLIVGVASLGAGGWIAKAGGQIRHPEFREMSVSSTNAAPHNQHGASEQSHEKMQPQTGGEHKHGETAEASADKIPMPETLEGIWKAIQAYRGELETAVDAKNFGEVKSAAQTIGMLAKKLVEVAPADHKPVVESGVTKITHALDELKSSADTGSDTVMKIRFTEFAAALAELEPQMKKP
jgi:hypothetical protein